MLGGCLFLIAGLVLEYGRGGSLQEIMGGAFVRDARTSLERGYPEGLRALLAAIEVKHPYTAGHADRVTEIALLIAQEMKLPPDRLRTIALGGILHDIGKIGVPNEILNKPGKLTDEEFAEIKRHPLLGDEMVSTIRSLEAARLVIRHHHEWVDGRGYPDRLVGEQIPLEARIIGVADTFEALTARRSYRKAFSSEKACEILRQEAGSHLDPDVVAVWLSIVGRWSRQARPRPFALSPRRAARPKTPAEKPSTAGRVKAG